MGRKRIAKIENEKNRRIAELVNKVVGDRTYKEAAAEAGINPSTLSYICRGKVKPTPDIISAITKPEANPQGGISVEELMLECGYQTAASERLIKYFEASGFKNQLNEPLRGTLGAQRAYEEKCATCRIRLSLAVLDKGYSVIKADGHNIYKHDGTTRLDARFEVANTGTNIQYWNFVFDLSARDLEREGWLYTTSVLGELLGCGPMNENIKLSYVTMNKQHFDALCRFEEQIAFRGELSIILMDAKCEEILEERYLSHYIEGDRSNEFTIAK